MPEVDFERFDSIKSHFNIFHDKLSQAGSLLLNIKHENLLDPLNINNNNNNEFAGGFDGDNPNMR